MPIVYFILDVFDMREPLYKINVTLITIVDLSVFTVRSSMPRSSHLPMSVSVRGGEVGL